MWRTVSISTAWCISHQGGIRRCAGIRAFPNAGWEGFKEDEEANSSSSHFSREGDEYGFDVTDEGHCHPPRIPEGSSAERCWCQIPMGLTLQDAVHTGLAQCFHLEKNRLRWQLQTNPPGLQVGKRPGLEDR